MAIEAAVDTLSTSVCLSTLGYVILHTYMHTYVHTLPRPGSTGFPEQVPGMSSTSVLLKRYLVQVMIAPSGVFRCPDASSSVLIWEPPGRNMCKWLGALPRPAPRHTAAKVKSGEHTRALEAVLPLAKVQARWVPPEECSHVPMRTLCKL